MQSEDIYSRQIKKMQLPLLLKTITFKKLQKNRRIKRLKYVKGSGVYIIEGERDGSTETLYD
ncbi:hypothetical protein OCF68_24430 [Bacillus cereus]|nr:hypothetical protein [Bacillus cereus]